MKPDEILLRKLKQLELASNNFVIAVPIKDEQMTCLPVEEWKLMQAYQLVREIAEASHKAFVAEWMKGKE